MCECGCEVKNDVKKKENKKRKEKKEKDEWMNVILN